MNINKLMKQAQKMQEQMAKTQAELEEKTVEVQAGGGKVTVVANGAGDVVSIKIAKEIVDPEDVEILEDLVLSGVQQAIEQGKALAQSEMTKDYRRDGTAAGIGIETLRYPGICHVERSEAQSKHLSSSFFVRDSSTSLGMTERDRGYNETAVRWCFSKTQTARMPNEFIFSSSRS